MDVYVGRLSGSEEKLVCSFKFAEDIVGVASGSLWTMWMSQHS